MNLQISGYRFKWLVLMLAVLTLTACGWRLRGSVSLPEQIQKINLIQLADYGGFNKRLIKALESAGAEVVESKVGADVSISVIKIDLDKKSAAVDSQGRTIAQDISLNLIYSLQDNEGNILAEQEDMRQSRIYRFDPDNVLAMEREESRVVSGLIDEMVAALISRVKHQVKSQANSHPKSKIKPKARQE